MATSSVILDIRANTQRALSEFKTFSSQLDNKFLVSGLKLDVVRSALSQINREFQRSMGEQGLVSSQSLKAAENQATLLTNIYTGFSKTASARITEDFSKALSEVAVRTGGTVSDIQKSLSISPFLSRSFSRQDRGAILGDLQRIQTFASQAGLGNNAGDIFKKIATGQTNFMELESSDDSLSKVIGARLRETAPVSDLSAVSIEERTRILKNLAKSLDVKELEELAKETGGFRVVLAKFSASLFNPKVGLFGAMKEFTLSTGEAPTTIFKETTKLFESIFGEQGFIKTLGKELARAFGIRGEDAAVKFLGRGIRFITNLIKNITDLIDDVINNPIVKGIVEIVRSAFDGIVKFISRLDEIAKNPPQFPDISKESVQTFIKEIGENVRGFLKKVGAFIRGEDISDEAEGGASIIGTIVDEAGNTILTFFKEVGDALLVKAGTIALELGKKIIPSAFSLFTKALTGEGGLIPQLIAAFMGGGLLLRGGGMLLGGAGFGLRKAAQVRNIYEGEGGLRGAMNRSVGSPFGKWETFEAKQSRLQQAREERRAEIEAQRMGRRYGVNPNDILSSTRTGTGAGGRYSLDPMFENIRKTNEINKFNQEFAESQRQFKTRELFQRRMATSQFRMEGPLEIGRYGSQYNTAIGPLPHGSAEPWTMANGRYQPYMGDVNEEALLESRRGEIARRQALGGRNPLTSVGRNLLGTSGLDAWDGGWDRSRTNTAARFNRRYGSGGTRAIMGRGIGRFGARIGGMGRGIGSYYRGGGGSGVTGLLGAGIGLGGTMLGESIGGETGENITALSQIGGGALSGASMGAMIGSVIPGVGTAIGAAVGAVIGGAMPLMDKGVRDAVGRFTVGIWKSLSDGIKGISDAISGGITSFQSGWNSAIKTAQDWVMNLLPQKIQETLKFFTETIPKTIKDFGASLATSMLDSVKNFNLGQAVLDTWESIKKNFTPRAVGGTVEKGMPYRVGERGEELFIPSQSGSIINNATLNGLASRSSGGSSNVTFNVTINATGLAGNDIAAAIQPAVIKILDDGMKQVSSSTITRGTTVI